LSEHIGLFFTQIGLDCESVVGIAEAVERAATFIPDVVICEYDLLATAPLDSWERDDTLSTTPVVAVSLTRKTHEQHLLDVNGIAGFFYLPTLSSEDAHLLLRAIRPPPRYSLPSVFNADRLGASADY
jgi:hypothetical protein